MISMPAKFASIAALLLLSACVTAPTGPTVLVLPGSGKSFDEFRIDDFTCRQFASQQAGDAQAANDTGVRSAALGTVVGAVAGALIGGNNGAAVGAGTGLLVGSAAGTGNTQISARGLQRRYDVAYLQCMYARGHRIPASSHLTTAPAQPSYPPPDYPPPATLPPPVR